MILDDNVLHIYTDGSCFSRPRRGGYAVRFVFLDSVGKEKTEDFFYPGKRGATNNQMELYACIKGLQEAIHFPTLDVIDHLIIFTDSRYVSANYKNALFRWPGNGWQGYEGPVLNVQYWKDLIKEIKRFSLLRKRVEIQWIKGHSKNIHNKAVDKLANIISTGSVGATFDCLSQKCRFMKPGAFYPLMCSAFPVLPAGLCGQPDGVRRGGVRKAKASLWGGVQFK